MSLIGYYHYCYFLKLVQVWIKLQLNNQTLFSLLDLFDEFLGGVSPWPEVCGDSDPVSALTNPANQAVGIFSGPTGVGGGNLTYGVCWELYEWCCYVPRIYISQYLIGFLLAMGVSYGFCFIMASTIYSKVLGTSNQVSQILGNYVWH